jgi:hypothetical protein
MIPRSMIGCYYVRAEGTFSLEWTGSGGGFTLPGKSTLAFAVIKCHP